jgi:Mrp family chromosome partitioning ATPase
MTTPQKSDESAQLEGLEPELTPNNRLVPLTAYGIKAMSMGFLVPQDSPIAWRGLMVQKAMNQLLFEVAWPRLDLLVLDLPPGTGDVQLTISQSVHLSGSTYASGCGGVVLLMMSYRCRHCLDASGSGASRCCEGV